VRQFVTSGRFAIIVLAVAAAPADCRAARPASTSVARQVDRAIAAEVFGETTKLAPLVDDPTFLRRVWLDIVGDIPTPAQLTAFVLDPAADKRRTIVRRLLDNPHYGQNWARYWRDVVFYRVLEERALIAANAMEVDLAEWLNQNIGWDQIAAKFVTARGDVQEIGSTAIMMAQDGRTEEMTAEISRIFLGIQIQCAQCHDHPYDRWKREQFHELAAFFPRVGVRVANGLTKRSFEVYASDRAARPRRKNNDRRPQPEHLMPDLDNPTAPGTTMQPKFFLTGATMPLGTIDVDRRAQLAQWLTSNEWFAIALVNRLWSELVGEGFYEPVDNLGPDRQATAPKTLKILARKFVASGYDLQWLIQTICQTEAYQRESRPRRGLEATPFVANVPQRLRSDQLYSAVLTALDVEEQHAAPRVNRRRASLPRSQFALVFGYDPSVARDTVPATIPQALALMNSWQIDRMVVARESNMLTGLLATVPDEEQLDEEQLIVELFLRCLSREPDPSELATARAYVGRVDNRKKAFEDLLWVILNMAEFRYRR